MIRGIGIDLADIDRIKHLLDRYGMRFLSRIFTREEIEYCMKKQEAAYSLAGRFAAKEAVFKALSLERQSGIGFKDIQVNTTLNGPVLKLTGRALTKAEEMGISRMHLSISHDRGCAVAMVVLENDR